MSNQVFLTAMRLSVLVCMVFANQTGHAKDEVDGTSLHSSIGSDGTGSIIVEAHGQLPELPVMFSANASATVQVSQDKIVQTVDLKIAILQGNAKTLSLGIIGDGGVTEVQGTKLISWAVRQEGSKRFLDLSLKDGTKRLAAKVKIRSEKLSPNRPMKVDLTHLSPGQAVGFNSIISINYDASVEGSVLKASGFAPLESQPTATGKDEMRSRTATSFQTVTGGQITLSINRKGSSPNPVEFVDSTLTGKLHSNGKSIRFQFQGTAQVTAANATVDFLSGNAAISKFPDDENYRLRLSTVGKKTIYKLAFSKAGKFAVTIDFVATVDAKPSNSNRVDFTVAASAIVPVSITGLDSNLKFLHEAGAIVPLRSDEKWVGFLPADGRAKLQWKASRNTGEGKLFFTTTGIVEATVGTGLLRQNHQVDFLVLQGELKTLKMRLLGPGEILDVQGSNITSWKVDQNDTAGQQKKERVLEVVLSQPISGASQIKVRSQTPLGEFPARVEGLRVVPNGVIRHSGYLRLSNSGLVRLEPTELSGLTQLAPEQFPVAMKNARQSFVYRFPSGEHSFTVVADRIEPEVNLSEVVRYQLADSDRVIQADIELDIREAPIREWNFLIPADYSVVSVVGGSVADYVTASEVANSSANGKQRNLKIIFGSDVVGRQLVKLNLEKSEAATEGEWKLPRIEHPDAKNVRGDIGIVAAPGFRISPVTTDLLIEKPLSYFPNPTANLQQAFRIRQREWLATMQIEKLQRSIQSDVFHLYSLTDEMVYGSALINYFVSGSPVSQFRIHVPEVLGNVMVVGQDLRAWRREGDTLIVSLHQPVMGAHTLLVTFEDNPDDKGGSFQAGRIAPMEVQGERGYVQVVSPMQVEIETNAISDDLLKLDPMELPAEFRLLSTAPALGTWQYTQRPFDLDLSVKWFEPGATVSQVVEFSEANSRVSMDGELVTEVTYFVKSRGNQSLKIQLPPEPVRLWAVSVNGQPVTARQTEDATLIPLPNSPTTGTDPNTPVEVNLRLGKPSLHKSKANLMLPIVFAPVLKTQWNIVGEEQYVLVTDGGTVSPPVPVLRPSGFHWLARRGLIPLALICLFVVIGISTARSQIGIWQVVGLLGIAIAIWISGSAAIAADSEAGAPNPLQLSIPVLSAGETVEVQVTNTPLWRANYSLFGLITCLVGFAAFAWSIIKPDEIKAPLLRFLGIVFVMLGVLMQHDGASWFFAMLAIALALFLFLPAVWKASRKLAEWRRSEASKSEQSNDGDSVSTDAFQPVSSVIACFVLSIAGTTSCFAESQSNFKSADSIQQEWQVDHQESRLTASGTVTLSGRPGDQFLLLKSPAVLTHFEGQGLRLSKNESSGHQPDYVISILPTDEAPKKSDEDGADADPEPNSTLEIADYSATFRFQLEATKPLVGIPVLTGKAVLQQIKFGYDEAGWDVLCKSAALIEPSSTSETTMANLLLGPGPATILLRPKSRDVSAEKTQFFVEADNLYLPGPGVVDGRHRVKIRVSQGQVRDLSVIIPNGLTVSAVKGPIGSWQFDADRGRLTMEVEPSQAQQINVMVETQRGLEPLPTDVTLEPLKIEDAVSQVGLMGIAFGKESQPEKLESKSMSGVNVGDFDATLLPNQHSVLHRVYRYGAKGGKLLARIAPVAPDVRVTSQQVLSFGDERMVLGVNFTAEITRVGLFQLSFPLPKGFEIESLSGPSLHHWAELPSSEPGNDDRQIILHLNGKTIGNQTYAMSLTGLTPSKVDRWQIPHFELNEANRQSGDLLVRPTTGIRLRTISRQNVSETDPRSMGADKFGPAATGSLAFRLLQRDWNLVLGIEKLDPWVTGQVLHEVTLREGQTRTKVIGRLNVQNASIRSLKIKLPITDADEIKTVRVIGETVSDFVRTSPDSNMWEIQLKRRVVGKLPFQIEYERRGDQKDDREALFPIQFPETQQLSYFFSVRGGGRLELDHGELSQGWQRVDWNVVPTDLREAENRSAPAMALRAANPATALPIHAKRHSLADSLKLRVAKGTLTSILSPTGDQLTAIDMTVEVIQRSSLRVSLPEGGELLSIFVNGESVNSIRAGDKADQIADQNAKDRSDTWKFTVLPGVDDRTANVRFFYVVTGNRISRMKLISPQLNVPLENIQWNVVTPKGYELTDHEGNLELIRQSQQRNYDRKSYLSKVSGKRQIQAAAATKLLQQANQLLQAGEQTKARRAFSNVANQYALDAASNEDARIQLENLQTQQAIVGLNTRRQRFYLDTHQNQAASANDQQLRDAAASNPILQDRLDFRPQQMSQLLQGNTAEDNAILGQIAQRLVQHQRTTVPAAQSITINLPEEGSVYTFSRSVQVSEDAPLELDLNFGRLLRLYYWQIASALILLALFAACFAFAVTDHG